MKKLLLSLGMASVALGTTGLASAAVIKGVSDSSTGTSAAKYLIKVLLTNNNNADLGNFVTSTGNTGGNTFTSADDQSGSKLVTGNASAATLVDNSANNNRVSEKYESAAGVDNVITDVSDSSTALTSSDDTLDNNIVNNNEVGVLNEVGSVSDSGSNAVASGDSLSNTSATTGDSDAVTGVSNAFNFNVKEIIRLIKFKVPTP